MIAIYAPLPNVIRLVYHGWMHPGKCFFPGAGHTWKQPLVAWIIQCAITTLCDLDTSENFHNNVVSGSLAANTYTCSPATRVPNSSCSQSWGNIYSDLCCGYCSVCHCCFYNALTLVCICTMLPSRTWSSDVGMSIWLLLLISKWYCPAILKNHHLASWRSAAWFFSNSCNWTKYEGVYFLGMTPAWTGLFHQTEIYFGKQHLSK